jgi:hypothetical protein
MGAPALGKTGAGCGHGHKESKCRIPEPEPPSKWLLVPNLQTMGEATVVSGLKPVSIATINMSDYRTPRGRGPVGSSSGS